MTHCEPCEVADVPAALPVPSDGADRAPGDGTAEEAASWTPPVTGGWASITACPDGPLLVRGDVEILLASGEPAPRRRATVALCRCGASGIKPYCDGSHKVVGFRTEDEPS
ncbi:CDGSH iron-sulfur domain-containing protein [Georgenia faecalis]|uniref:CDGSH iron-sulfur domain-containing protein n=1 Tax=Georgenia faecalis TaxID=2483799 RepID=A0ABV9DEH0_9MICO